MQKQQSQLQNTPLFSMSNYVSTVRGPVRGPQANLAWGTGRTGSRSAAGTGAQLPGYVSDNDYQPSPFSYQPMNHENFGVPIPRRYATAEDGRVLVGTYQPHAFTPGQRFTHQMRSAPNWQETAFPRNFRNILSWQQPNIYRVKSATNSARPLLAGQYFLGYQIQSSIQGQIGQNSLGYLGSV